MTIDASNLPDARELRQCLDSSKAMAAQAQLMSITTKITRALETGQTSVTLFDVLEPGVEGILLSRHYAVTAVRHRSERKPYKTIISW